MKISTVLILNDIMELIEEFGTTDGAHHKQWLIDQIVRVICGTDEQYAEWRKGWIDRDVYENGDVDEYDLWDEGIAP